VSGGDVVVAGWTGATNLGDELVHAGIRRLLARVGVDDPLVVSQRPDVTRAAFGGRAVGPAAGLAAIRTARLLVWGGGGIVQDETSSLNLPYHLARPAAAVSGRVPFVGVGLGVGPLVGATAARQVRLLRRAVGLTVRDPASAELLTRVGVPGAVVASDAALALDPVDVPTQDVLVASLRPWEPSVTGAARLLPVSLRARLRGGAAGGTGSEDEARLAHHAAVLDAAAAATGLPVRLVALDTAEDAPLLTAVADRLRCDVDLVVPGVHDVVGTIAAARVVVAMRYHAGIAATLGGRPLVALSYSPKVTALATALGSGAARLPWDAAPADVATAAARLAEDDTAPAAVAAARDALRGRASAHEALLARALAAAPS
jgi:polysaccharide pyruvyl transferase WcaK-like protein